MENMPFQSMIEWIAFQKLKNDDNEKLDYYLARITAMLQAKLDRSGRYDTSQFLLGRRDAVSSDLRNATSEELKEMWRAALPYATYKEADDV